ncbi:MAG TPA: hypothetical protein VKZ79_06525 [Alphaproteobacteria bacterium]|nr:hypothetical protein [Alphaproteobacteria bacterium]
MSNPIATAEQAAFERRALKLLEHPEIRRTREEVRARWLAQAAPSADQRRAFDWAFDEVMFGAAIWSLNQDPQRPAVVTITRLPHKLGGLDIPGSRWGIDNPDSIYRVIPIDGGERYLIRGRVAEHRMTENYFTLWDEKMGTVDVLNGKDLVLGPDRSFTVTVDGEPANGRSNHIRSSPAAKEFYIRDVMLDWTKDRANELTIEKLGPPKTPPRSEAEQVALTASFMRKYAENTVRWNAPALNKPVNSFQFTIDRDTDGALRNQVYILGHFRVADDEALVIDFRPGDAAYFIVPITNVWGTTNDIVGRTGSLNKSQSVPNPDGSYSFVVSIADPGVHNWVDPCGMHDGILTLRWAEFPSGRPGTDLGADSRVVKLSDLADTLPRGTKFVTPAERRQQCEARAQSYSWRLEEN